MVNVKIFTKTFWNQIFPDFSSFQLTHVQFDLGFFYTRMLTYTDYGRPMKPFFIKIRNFWAWADKLGRYILGHLGYFGPNYQHPFWYSESLVHVFHYSTIISTKN